MINRPKKHYQTGKFQILNESFTGSNITKQSKKINKDDIWFSKQYDGFNPISYDENDYIFTAYELEAISSDFYRYILTSSRAAKSRVESPEESQNIDLKKLYIHAQKNRSGFKEYSLLLNDMDFLKRRAEIKEKLLSYGFRYYESIDQFEAPETGYTRELWQECGEIYREYNTTSKKPHQKQVEEHLYKKHFTAKAGFWEIQLARRMLSEGDANFQNIGLNDKGEVSIFDYDWTFYDIKTKYFRKANAGLNYDTIRNKDIADLFHQAELELAGDTTALDRFYKCQLRTILLTDTKLICSRHTASSMFQNDIDSLYLNNVKKLKEVLLNSNGFNQYFKERINFENLEDEFKGFFKHEQKKKPDAYKNCIDSFKMDYQNFSKEIMSHEISLQLIDMIYYHHKENKEMKLDEATIKNFEKFFNELQKNNLIRINEANKSESTTFVFNEAELDISTSIELQKITIMYHACTSSQYGQWDKDDFIKLYNESSKVIEVFNGLMKDDNVKTELKEIIKIIFQQLTQIAPPDLSSKKAIKKQFLDQFDIRLFIKPKRFHKVSTGNISVFSNAMRQNVEDEKIDLIKLVDAVLSYNDHLNSIKSHKNDS